MARTTASRILDVMKQNLIWFSVNKTIQCLPDSYAFAEYHIETAIRQDYKLKNYFNIFDSPSIAPYWKYTRLARAADSSYDSFILNFQDLMNKHSLRFTQPHYFIAVAMQPLEGFHSPFRKMCIGKHLLQEEEDIPLLVAKQFAKWIQLSFDPAKFSYVIQHHNNPKYHEIQVLHKPKVSFYQLGGIRKVNL